ncbi:hydroxyproline-rich glycoprotein family protein [Rhynchospora pubera]|uniref:Hydroxyproline-rich glycoprotein family protein n=1 Tax=Rhynchospora pubera TaxID=906938 RepID=A0AAV8EH46_9POAL|nr:hydroxyproline-rich glycoprotein family protein [Rhynchospora pubera]
MKSSLKKIRDFALHRGDQNKDPKRRDGPHVPVSPHVELLQAAKEMQDMKNGYDSLLSAAAATANSAFEFSEALREMGSCLLEKITLNDDDESRKVLLMLGKAQFELQKIVDSYRAHVVQTISTPSESLVKELQTVEEMKRQCDDKRDLYKFMQATQSSTNNKGGKSSKQGKGADSFSYEQVKQAQDDYNEEATLFVFRLKSLKQGQFRSLLTQATRHHAAQLNFFRKGVRSLETVEPQVRAVAESQHIDYHFTELDDDLDDDDDDGDMYPDGRDDISNDGSELSFDYGQGKRASNATAQFPRKSLDEHADSNQSDSLTFFGAAKPFSQSEPLLANKSPDRSDRIKAMLQNSPSVKRNPNTYVLPTPTGENNQPRPSLSKPSRAYQSQPLWFSSPLQPNPNATIKNPKENEHLLPTPQKLPLKESNIVNPRNKNRNYSDSETKKAKISELHELPRPPPARSPASSPLVPHSAPLVSKPNQEREKEKRVTITSISASKNVPSPLPAPPGPGAVMARSYSIPSSGTNRREDRGIDGKLIDGFKAKNLKEETSPPLTPIGFRNVPQSCTDSE